ncbi:hypothetical protein CEP48_08110 [Mergibacter septicus]|uniref:Opioid growth factor receptor (OGFr) conserved domain-containing protein n=1 Tax=Mergibacter septicus TaxID=221402 RepID=A0A8E3MH28_9PAST|nr:opioid growth factor receptor-related protein [Mergibacter septicus]AWX16132.1 hypothetical protein CEP47_08110 [Mergibacter septicus]QDJ15385.1 hypothetical protein CEP48_08110 [Mergibacter septicus]UTU48745.1 hypothetical protein HLL31_08325 [Mergibacter septicus]WMR95623.1 opioid growth factor receptor-related protein [Mergibacter septicus]
MSLLIDFYLGKLPNRHNKSLYDIWALDKFWLENDHHYIQWLFPLDIKSSCNLYAPIITKAEREIFSNSDQLKKNQIRSLDLMLDFFGLSREGINISAQENLNIKDHIWLKRGGHNHLRITRIIRSLGLCSQISFAKAFQATVIKLGQEKGKVEPKTISYWENALLNLD